MSIFFSKTLPLINYLWILFQAEQQPQIWIPSCITSENEQEIVFFLYFFPEPQNTARFLSFMQSKVGSFENAIDMFQKLH